MADEDALKEALQLPLDERATHANWKVRSAAFEDIKTGVSRVFSSEDPVLSDYGEDRRPCGAVSAPHQRANTAGSAPSGHGVGHWRMRQPGYVIATAWRTACLP